MFYGIFAYFLISIIKKKIWQKVLVMLLFLLPIIYLFPIFQGKLFYSKERAVIRLNIFKFLIFLNSKIKKLESLIFLKVLIGAGHSINGITVVQVFYGME